MCLFQGIHEINNGCPGSCGARWPTCLSARHLDRIQVGTNGRGLAIGLVEISGGLVGSLDQFLRRNGTRQPALAFFRKHALGPQQHCLRGEPLKLASLKIRQHDGGTGYILAIAFQHGWQPVLDEPPANVVFGGRSKFLEHPDQVVDGRLASAHRKRRAFRGTYRVEHQAENLTLDLRRVFNRKLFREILNLGGTDRWRRDGEQMRGQYRLHARLEIHHRRHHLVRDDTFVETKVAQGLDRGTVFRRGHNIRACSLVFVPYLAFEKE
ncbi:hypothetical protein D9M70_519020 [compost metagenome]